MRQIGRHLALSLVVFAAAMGVGTAEASHHSCESPTSTIAFVSTRHEPVHPRLFGNWEIWLMNGDGTDPRRLTVNPDEGDFQATLSPDGKGRIVFDSNRNQLRGQEPINISDLFLMNQDGTEQTLLTRGSSATWSPNGKRIAFHRSASFTAPPAVGVQRPIRADPGAPSFDSDIFVAKVRDLLDGEAPRNITNTEDFIEDDADWSPNGKKIAFTRHRSDDNQQNSVTAEICVMKVKGHREPRCFLGDNLEEERAPDWSPDGKWLAYMCRKGGSPTGGPIPTFEICVIKADGTGAVRRLTTNTVFDGTTQWSSDGQTILFSRGATLVSELWLMDADGTDQRQFTDTEEGFNGFGNWGEICDEEEDEDDGGDDDDDDNDDNDDEDDDDHDDDDN